MSKLSFIGIGNMGSAMALGALKNMSGENIYVSDADQAKAKAFCQEHGANYRDSNAELARLGDYIVISVKVFILPGVLEEIRPVLEAAADKGERKVLVPIAAGVFHTDLRRMLGDKICDHMPIVRCLPTIYALLGCGLQSCSIESDFSRQAFDEISELMKGAGTFELMPESMIDLASTASGATPAFTTMFIEAMADGMVLMGMPRDKAIDYCARGVYGGAAMVLEKNKHPEAIKDAVCSPGGSTIVGVNMLEKNNFRYAAMEATHQAALKLLKKE